MKNPSAIRVSSLFPENRKKRTDTIFLLPSVLPSPFPKFRPTIAKHLGPLAKHSELSMKTKANQYVTTSPERLARLEKHPAGPARLAKPHR